MQTGSLLFAVLLLFGSKGILAAEPPDFYVHVIPTAPPTQRAGAGVSINASGSVAGVYSSQIGVSGMTGVSFTYIGGTYTTLPSPGPVPGFPAAQDLPIVSDINDAGAIVGYTYGGVQAFLYQGGSYFMLGALAGDSYSQAAAINGSGQIAGQSQSSTGARRAFLFSAGTMQDIGSLVGSGGTSSMDIDSAGRVLIASYADDGSVNATYLYSGGSVGVLGAFTAAVFNSSGEIAATAGNQLTIYSLSATSSQTFTAEDFTSINVSGFNSLGQAIGTYRNGSASGGFFFSDGVFYDFKNLLAPGQVGSGDFVRLSAINDSGEITGGVIPATFPANGGYPVIFNAVPEPRGLPLVGAGLLVLVLWKARSQLGKCRS